MEYRPIVNSNGQLHELPVGDTIAGAGVPSLFDFPPASDLPTPPTEVLVVQNGVWVRATWTQLVGWLGGVTPSVVNGFLTEDGLYLTTEDGNYLQQE